MFACGYARCVCMYVCVCLCVCLWVSVRVSVSVCICVRMSNSVYPYLSDLWVCVLGPGLHNAWMFLSILSVCLFVSKLEHVLVGMVEREK